MNDGSKTVVTWGSNDLPWQKFKTFINVLDSLNDSIINSAVKQIKVDTKQIGLVQYGRFIALGEKDKEKGFFDLLQISDPADVLKNPESSDKTPFTPEEKDILRMLLMTKYLYDLKKVSKKKRTISIDEEEIGCIEVETVATLKSDYNTFWHFDTAKQLLLIGTIYNEVKTSGSINYIGSYDLKKKSSSDYLISSTKFFLIKPQNIDKITGGGFYKKYLKYKSKYLQIK
jgi:hypothetical protein